MTLGVDNKADAEVKETVRIDEARNMKRVGGFALAYDIRYDPDDNIPVYVGLNETATSASTAGTTWTIFKNTYVSGSVTRTQKQINVAWDDRTSGW